jgi:hypothetical protein
MPESARARPEAAGAGRFAPTDTDPGPQAEAAGGGAGRSRQTKGALSKGRIGRPERKISSHRVRFICWLKAMRGAYVRSSSL